MPFNIASTLITALLLGSGPASAEPKQQTNAAPAELTRLLPYLDNDARALPEDAGQSSSCSARLLASALGYRRNPDKHRNDFFGELVIDDYADRAAGKYNYVSPDNIASTIDTAMAAPAGITDDRVKAVIGFCALKDKNLWVATQRAGRVSLARVVRGLALSSLLKGTDEDPLAIANAIDAHTAAARRPSGQ